VRLTNVTLSAESVNLDNYNSKDLSPSSILTVIPITSAPYQTQYTDHSMYGSLIGIYISNETLHQLDFDITDKDGNHATFLPDWTATLQIQIMDMEDPDLEDMKHSLQSVKDVLNKMLTLKVIGRGAF
jgi:hypothetical protein